MNQKKLFIENTLESQISEELGQQEDLVAALKAQLRADLQVSK